MVLLGIEGISDSDLRQFSLQSINETISNNVLVECFYHL